MKKRLLSLLLAAVLLLAILPASPVQAAELKAFSDVKSTAWYAPYVYALVQEGIINGITPTTFAPSEPLTRAQLMKMLACFAADEAAIKAAAAASMFTDVAASKWYTGYVNWAADQGVTKGYEDGSFRPDQSVSRAETATLADRFASVTDSVELKPVQAKAAFSDDASIPKWAKDSVYLCQQAGVINGYPNNTFVGANQITRGEAAKVLCLLLGVEPLAKEDVPKSPVADVRTLPSTVAGYSVTGVEFDPEAYNAGIVLADNRLFAVESAASMAKRSGAAIACNGAFFNNNGDLTTWSGMIRDGRALRLDKSYEGKKCYFVIDQNGHASMQFMIVRQAAQLLHNGEEVYTVPDVGCNFTLDDGDNSCMVFTPEYGKQVPIKMKAALYCDNSGKVTDVRVYDTKQTISIPSTGFVICMADPWHNFFSGAHVGDQVNLTLSYQNSSVQNVRMAFCCGPTVVKNGAVYGNRTTAAEEGYFEGQVVSGSSQRMAIGVKKDGTVVMAGASCDLQGLGRIMQALGCETAMNLDGGSSRALYVGGSARIAAGRSLTHLIVFTQK